jgi:hypothetical protein
MEHCSILFTNDEYENCILYVIEYLNRHPLKPKDLLISANQDVQNTLTYALGGNIPRQDYIFSHDVVVAPQKGTYKFFQDSYVYSIERENRAGKFYDGLHFGFDIIETIFFHLSRYEEFYWPQDQLNPWGMMPEEKQFLIANRLNFSPIVDQLVSAFFEVLTRKKYSLPSTTSISHDIDYISRFHKESKPLHFVASLLKRQSTALVTYGLDFLNYSIRSREPYTAIFDQFKSLELNKTIYMHIGGNHKYDLRPSKKRNEALIKIIKLAKYFGYSVGLHPSYLTASDIHLFEYEKKMLEEISNETIMHSRQHYLHFSWHDTLSILEINGIKKDSSLGYNDHIGFRAGTGFEYPLFDLKTRKTSSIIEIPIALMDSALWSECKKNKEAFNNVLETFYQKNEYDTHIHISVHNSAWYDYRLYGVDMNALLHFNSKMK